MVDFLIIGLGLAGISFCEQLQSQGKSLKVISDGSQQSSMVAGGLYNPVILKRFTLAWQAKEQMNIAMPFYENLENKLGTKLDYKVPVFRRFTTIEEQNKWFEACDKPGLDYFLLPKVIQNTNDNLDAAYGFGEVRFTGRIDTKELLRQYKKYLISKDLFINDALNYDELKLFEDYVSYKKLKARHVIFAEGFGLKQNPFFNYLPLNGTKGELLTIKAPKLKEKSVIKSSVFIIPLGDDLYRIGATYKWKDKTNNPTEASKSELLDKLQTLLKCEYQVVEHVAGVRPTVTDRRPLVGRHPEHYNLYVLNGFGSRGVLIAPYASKQLLDYILHNSPLDEEMDIVRFTKKHYLS
ncbi:MAG: FAD-binding oxidoreductase [Croceitalea sp.]|nr:FAD-binding oxidoreductase [Croceitalea sp.]